MSQLNFAFGKELIVDNFAGGGGASLGIEQAFGRPVDIAINHDPEAVTMHTANHPHTKHYCENVWEVDPREATHGRQVGLAWFSPDCKHFSKAKGGKPVEKKIRGLAWVVLRWAAKVKPRVIMLENVEEFTTWGPLTPEGKPCPKRKGNTFRSFINALKRHGYKVDHRPLRACDYGAPTIRKRLFLIARCDNQPIVWPEPTHGPDRAQPYKTAADCIDWSVPAPSIFTRKRPLAEATMRRIARGLQRFVIDHPDPFIINIDHQSSPSAEYPLSDPLGTITSKARQCLVAPFIAKVNHGYDYFRGQSIDDPIQTLTQKNGYGLVVPYVAKHFGGMTGVSIDTPFPTITARGTQNQLVTAFLQRHFGKSVGSSATDPLGTVTAGGGGKSSLVTSHLVKLRGTCKDGQDIRQPLPTITAGGLHIGEVRAFLLKYYGTATGQDPRDPLHSVTSKARFGLVTVHGEPYQIVDIGMRMLTPRELYRAQGFTEDYIIDPEHNGKPLTKTAQVRMCGNSVCPPLSRAIVEANVGELKRVEAA